MRGSWRLVVAIGFVGMLLAGSGSVEAFIDDMEEDFWLPFTHFHLGDRASAGYASGFGRSGTRAFHVDIRGWAVRDFGSAYGYALFPTRKAPMTELRVSLLYDRLQDVVTSPWDAYAAGISLDLVDASYHASGGFDISPRIMRAETRDGAPRPCPTSCCRRRAPRMSGLTTAGILPRTFPRPLGNPRST